MNPLGLLAGFYVRAAGPGVMPPNALRGDHPLVREGAQCLACLDDFREGDLVSLLVLGPGDDPEEQAKWREGRWCNAVALPLHAACAGYREVPAG